MTSDASSVDLPPEFQALLAPDPASIASLYNDLGRMGDDDFAAAFDDSLHTLREVADVDRGELALVLGLGLHGGAAVGATVLSVRVLGGDAVLHTAGGGDVPDAVVYLPIRPGDCPPGSGNPVADLAMVDYREMIASMVFLRHELVENASDRYDELYGRPLARGLEAYAGQ